MLTPQPYRGRARFGRARPTGDAGITLTELVVTMSLMSIVAALALTSLLGTNDISTRTTEAGLGTASARTTMGSWTGLLHVAVISDPAAPDVRALTITPTAISFRAQLASLPSCTDACATGAATAVTLAQRTVTEDGPATVQLVETLGVGDTARTRVLVPSGVAVDGGCLFHPYAFDGTDLTCKPMTAIDSAKVGRVDIAFTVTDAAGRVQKFRSSAKLPGAS